MNKIAIILIGIILLVVYGLLGVDYMKQGSEHERLLSEIEEVKQEQEALGEPSSDVYEQLTLIQAALAAENEVIPSEIDSNSIVDAILSVAQQIDVKAIPLVTQPWQEVRIGENTYRVFRVNVGVEGLFSQVEEYVSNLENGGGFNTLIVERLIVEVNDEETYAGDATPVVASLDLAVFTQP